MSSIISIVNIIAMITIVLVLTCLKDKIEDSLSASVLACLIVVGAIVANIFFIELDKVALNSATEKAKIEALSDVGYRALTEEELLDLSPNQLKEYLQVGDVYLTN